MTVVTSTAKDLVFLTPSSRDTPALREAKAKMINAVIAQYRELLRVRSLGVDCGVYSQVGL